MKKIVNLFLIAAIAVFNASCGGNNQNAENKDQQDTTEKVNQTVENLKAALQGETTASVKYEAFAAKAKEENLPQIAALFNATSKSESIHAANHKKVLEEMGEVVNVTPEAFEVKTTKENLEAAFNGEKHEVENMYQGFIDQAEVDEAEKAVKTFTYAFETEKAHMKLYTVASEALAANKVKTISADYLICPKCGFTYTGKDAKDECEICSTGKDKYIVVK